MTRNDRVSSPGDLQRRVEAFIAARGRDLDFDSLALDVFAHQFETVPLYRKFCERRGVTPSRVHRWAEVPFLPAEAFKQELGLAGPRPHEFWSSGTTQGAAAPSRVALSTLETYRLSALTHFADLVLADGPGPMAVLILAPTATTHPRSSLGRMFSWCAEEFGHGPPHSVIDPEGKADIESAIRWLAGRASDGRPVLVLAVSSALSALFAGLRERGTEIRLPADSRIVDTGGAKGIVKVLSARAMLKAAWRFLHVPAYACVNEYGMTEMLSQLYDDVLISRVEGRLRPRSKVGPAWLKTSAVDPATLEVVDAGKPGILRHFDLASWETVSAIQTLDVGAAVGSGFEVRGRMPMAEARGCSQLMRIVEQ